MLIQHQIGGLQIPEDDGVRLAVFVFVVVQIREHIAQFDGPLHHRFLGQGAAAGVVQVRFQVLAFDVLHHQEGAITLVEVIIDFGDGGVVERGQGIGLALEDLDHHLAHAGIGDVDDLFNGHKFGDVGEAQIAGLVDRAHAAHPQDAHDRVAVLQNRARPQTAIALALQAGGHRTGDFMSIKHGAGRSWRDWGIITMSGRRRKHGRAGWSGGG